MTTSGGDPHHTLGVARDATVEEIRRAYRALAKRHHPDAGQGSVARFLEIQAAYEALVGGPARGAAGRAGRRPAQGAGASAAGPGTSPGAEWARRPRGASARRAGEAAPPGGGSPGNAPGAGPPPSAADPAGGPARPRSRDAAGGRRADRRRATLGSTSYDEAEEVFEPDWGGASWYGPTSGRYWTLNPKEYADPRKHGPEYQARARWRGARGAAAAGAVGPDVTGRARDAAAETHDTAAANEGVPGADPEGWATGDGFPPAWRATWTAARPPGGPPPPFEHEPASPRSAPHPTAAAVAASGPGARPGATASPGVLARVVLAVVGWLPVGLALAAVAGLPGGLVATMPLQVLGLALLAFRPQAAWAAAGGAVAVVFGAIPIVAVVAALGGGFAPGGPAPLAAIMMAAGAWLGGAIVAASGRVAAYPWSRGA